MNYNEQHIHPRDSRLSFDEAAHIYTVDGVEYETVTTLVEDTFEKFDAEYWAARKATPECPAEMLKKQWEEKGRIARDLGTVMHDNIERHYLGLEPNDAAPDRAFDNFKIFAANRKLQPYRSEWRIFIEEFHLAGTLDFLAVTDDGQFEIWDWKRSNKVVDASGNPIKFSRYSKRAKAPLEHLPDTTFQHYALQVSIYRYILSQKYGIDTCAGHLGVFHPDYDQPYVVDLPYLEDEVITLLNTRR
jgi:hypothetical protein